MPTSDDRNASDDPTSAGRSPSQPGPSGDVGHSGSAAPPGSESAVPTPAIERLLARVRRRLVALVWMHGVGTALAATSAWLAVAFLIDWLLHVPAGVRWFHLAVLAMVPAVLLLRELVRPLRRLPRQDEIAVLVERAHPELHELLVSAVQLGASRRAPDTASGAPELIADVRRRAEKQAGSIPVAGVLDERGPRRRLLLGAGAALGCALLLFANGPAAAVFFDRLFGGDSPWPRRTHLAIEIPLPGAFTPSEFETAGHEPAEIRLRVARGNDVPLVVRAEGVVPDEVVLHFKGGQRAVLASTGGPVFRTLLRSLQENTEFYATGGDDQDEIPWVRLEVLQPPDVEALAVLVTPPAYSGLAPRIEFDRDIEVLAGSTLAIHVLPTPRSAHGSARLLPEDHVVPLSPRPFPTPDAAHAPADLGGASKPVASAKEPEMGLGFDLVAEKNLRYRFELSDSTGLSNPDPGLFAVNVVEDRAPEIEVLSPSRNEFDTLSGGLIALRVRVEDDFGIAGVHWTSAAAGDEDRGASAVRHELEWRRLGEDERRLGDDGAGPSAGANSPPPGSTPSTPSAAARGPARVAAVAHARIEVRDLARPGAAAPNPGVESDGSAPAIAPPVNLEGQQFQIVALAEDNCAPTAHEGRSSPVRVRVVTSDEFVRRLQDRLARVQASTNALAELQRDKSRRTEELLSVLESDQLVLQSAENEVGTVSTGQRRVQGDARSLSREICSVSESVLYARLDERAGSMLEFVDQRLALSTRKSFDPTPWSELAAACARGELGKGALSGKLIEIVGLALDISEDESRGAVDALARAQQATEVKAVHSALVEAAAHQKATLEKLDRLLEMLAEWDNFQSVLGLTRDLLNGQKNLQERTKASLKEK